MEYMIKRTGGCRVSLGWVGGCLGETGEGEEEVVSEWMGERVGFGDSLWGDIEKATLLVPISMRLELDISALIID